jgi:preprotein translocase subunit SecA
MLQQIARKVFGSRNERTLRRLRRRVVEINALEERFRALDEAGLRATTETLRARRAAGEDLDALLPEAFAAVREAARRRLGLRPFDVQLLGGMVLHEGRIAEMATGEGKTLVAVLPAYLNALDGKGVHVVTVNDYLARRDAQWMRPIYEALGLTADVIFAQQDLASKQRAYRADVTYGTNNEFGFDYLRDNMAFAPDERVQRGLHYAIVDEVDSVLIDEARTPLIISGPVEEDVRLYQTIDRIARRLVPQKEEGGNGDFEVDEKAKQVHLTEEGHARVERLMTEAGLLPAGQSLYDLRHLPLLHHLNAALRAHTLYRRETDYIVRRGEVVIVDEFTGRTMEGRRWSDGLHQAIEAKEGVRVQAENQTLATITFQNYFRLYDKLSGMTGTADTEAYEFMDIYRLEVVVVPTNRPMIRRDLGDLVYLGRARKFEAVVEDIAARHERGQPVLVGTTSIENSEHLSTLLKKRGLAHEVLNAKQHAREALIIRQAGRPGAITIATNMAGRGTDIVLGGNLEAELAALPADDEDARARTRADWEDRHRRVLEAGGLAVIGTERHESRRIDNQLRGRSGRQGDPGETRFYVSLEDDLMRIFAADRVKGLMERLGMHADDALEHEWVTRAIENAQRKVEAHNYDLRKQLLDYDDVANEQRKLVYEERKRLLDSEDVGPIVDDMRAGVIRRLRERYLPAGTVAAQWDVAGLETALRRDFGIEAPVASWLRDDPGLTETTIEERIAEAFAAAEARLAAAAGAEDLKALRKQVLLYTLDTLWKEHLAAMDYLRQGIHLRGYAQEDPKQAYKREAFAMFTALLDRIQDESVATLLRVEVVPQAAPPTPRRPETVHYEHPTGAGYDPAAGSEADEITPRPAPYVREGRKIGRNEPCPCGSGLKYKQCHGRLDR